MSLRDFSDADMIILRELVREAKSNRTRQNRPTAESLRNDNWLRPPTSVHMALPTAGAGIAPMSGNRAGTDLCDIYHIEINDSTGDAEVKQIEEYDINVYNISKRRIWKNAQGFIPIWKTPAGFWIAWGPETALGQADSSISAGSNATVSLYYWSSGTWTDTTVNVTARNGTDQIISSGSKVALQWDHRSAQWIAGPLSC